MLTLKKTIAHIMLTTGAALVILAAFFQIIDDDIIYVRTIFEIFGANIVINFGIFLAHKFESRYAILEYVIDISLIIAVLAVFGIIFDWYSGNSGIPVWLLAVMGVVIYLFVIITNLARIRKDTREINELLQKRKEKNVNNAS